MDDDLVESLRPEIYDLLAKLNNAYDGGPEVVLTGKEGAFVFQTLRIVFEEKRDA